MTMPIPKIVGLVLLACLALNGAGFAVDLCWASSPATFFTLHIASLRNLPYWLLANFALLALEGWALFRLGALRLGIHWGPSGLQGELEVPVIQFLGLTLVFVAGLVALYIVASVLTP